MRGRYFILIGLSILAALVLSAIVYGLYMMNPNTGQRSSMMKLRGGDVAWAVETIKWNAKWGAPWAQYELAVLYSEGIGVTQDRQQELIWLRKASLNFHHNRWSGGEIFSFGDNGHFYENYFALAAQSDLGERYRLGLGVEKDLILAYLYQKNVLRRYEETVDGFFVIGRQKLLGGITTSNVSVVPQARLDTLVSEMTEDEIARAEARLVNWTPEIN